MRKGRDGRRQGVWAGAATASPADARRAEALRDATAREDSPRRFSYSAVLRFFVDGRLVEVVPRDQRPAFRSTVHDDSPRADLD